MLKIWLTFIGLICTSVVWAAPTGNPVGVWKTTDGKGVERSLVSIMNVNGKLSGKIIKNLPASGRAPNAKCDKCQGANYNQPILGMTILWGLIPAENNWQHGKILDVETGKVYHCSVSIIDNQHLAVRVTSGIFWRTLNWTKM